MALPRPFLVAAGGIAGASARWSVLHVADDADWALLAINALGSFVLGMVAHGALRAGDSRHLALGVGFCGALTTFSTLAVDAARHLDEGAPGDSAALIVLSIVTGVAAMLGGMATRRRAA